MNAVELTLAVQAIAAAIGFLSGVALADGAIRARNAIARIRAELATLAQDGGA